MYDRAELIANWSGGWCERERNRGYKFDVDDARKTKKKKRMRGIHSSAHKLNN